MIVEKVVRLGKTKVYISLNYMPFSLNTSTQLKQYIGLIKIILIIVKK